jgi:protease IV
MRARRGVFVFLFLLAILGGAVLFAALALRGSAPAVAAGTVLVFDVPEQLEESVPPMRGLSADLLRRDRPTLWRLVRGIRQAADDDRIAALVVHLDRVDWGWAKVAEVRDALLEFRRSGKPLYASLSGGGEREYLLATAADRIAAPPLAVLQLDGLTASALFLRGTFDKLDISPNFAHVGRYKAGVEGYTRTTMSPEAREALEDLLEDRYRLLVDSLAAARGIGAAEAARILDEGPYAAPIALARGLIDTLLYAADLDSLAARHEGEQRPTLPLRRYLQRAQRSGGSSRIALVVVEGVIAEGRSRETPGEGRIAGSETLVKALRDACGRSSVRTLVLRIDSPGGSAPASDEIWRAVDRCRRRMPVIASMSDVAASGGYWIAMAADSVIAQPGTVTGSIGVYGGKLNVLGLYRKLGLNVETLARGRHAEMLSPFRDFTPEEADHFRRLMEVTYDTFLERVSQGRGLERGEVDSVGRGRVWSGLAALERRLVDELGGLDRALEVARARAGLGPEAGIEVYPKVEFSFLQQLLAGLLSDEEIGTWGPVPLPRELSTWLAVASFPAGVPLALMPFSFEFR